MPTYEYECTKCENRFEAFQGMKEAPLTDCHKCSSPLKRLIGSGAGIIFKGSGFYATDYKAKKESKREANACPNTSKDNPDCKSCEARSADK